MIKKFFFVLFILFSLCIYFYIFGWHNTANIQKEKITFSSWGSVTEVQIIQKIISEFEKENPDIEIEFIHIPQNYYQKLHLLFASNTAPDVIFINNLYLPLYASKLEDLSNVIEINQYFPQSISALSYENRILCIPRDISTLVLYVNTDILKEHNLPVPDTNWTLEDLLYYAQQTTSSINFGIGHENGLYWILPYLTYYGGGVFDKNFNSTIQNSDSQKGIKFYQDLKYKYNVMPSKSDIGSKTLTQMFLDGKICMYLSGRWMFPKISETGKFNWIVMNFPIGKNPQYCDASGWAISKNSKHKRAAIRFIKYLSNDKNSIYFTQTGLIVPAKIKSSEIIKNNHNAKIFSDIIKYTESTPVNKNYKKLTDEIEKKYNLE